MHDALDKPYRLIGANPSPYSVKMRAVMRYRRLPFFWEVRNPENTKETEHIRPPVMPYLQYPDGTFHNDTTPMIFDLEKRHPGQRSVVPDDPAFAFIAHLIEDFGDEWATKFMVNYRWNYEDDQRFCSQWIAHDILVGHSEREIDAFADSMRKRQMQRRPLFGSTPAVQPMLELTYRQSLEIFQQMLGETKFLFGSRPSLADFGWFGQLYQCAMDPTAGTFMKSAATAVYFWILRLDDASGVVGDWVDSSDTLSPAVRRFLAFAGELYLPLLCANAIAAKTEQKYTAITAFDLPYEQLTNSYQVKCLKWLYEAFDALVVERRHQVEMWLDETGCLKYFVDRPV